nr:TIGR01777 family oxidoreductase [Campylobacterota bacterium]
EGVDVVINLAGAPIIKRWSDPYKQVLVSSRLDSTKKIVQAVNQSDVKHFISTSAIGIYPDNVRCDETCSVLGNDFLANLSSNWEAEANACTKATTILRFGVVLGLEGGALKQMLTPFKMGVGGIIGDGKMVSSWIDIEDLMRIYDFVIEKQLEGTFNATAPNPVSNHVFTKALGKALNRLTILPLPILALKLMYGEASTVLTGSKEVIPQALLDAGFSFKYPTIDASFTHLIENK